MKKFLHNLLISIVLFLGAAGISVSVYAYPKAFAVNAEVEKEKGVKMKEPVAINFSEYVFAESVEKSLKIYPETEIIFSWSDSGKKLIITPINYWEPETIYNIKIVGGRSMALTSVTSDLFFETAEFPSVESFYPASGAKDVVIDIEEPIIVKFTDPLEDFKIKVKIEPFEKLTYNFDETKTELKILSYGGFKRGQRYDIYLYAKYKNAPDDSFRQIYETFFETKPMAPEDWAEDFGTRLIQAKRFTEAKIKTGKYIDINLQTQIMTIFENGKLLDAFLVSSGKRGMDTPIGSFKIENKTSRAWSSAYGLYMPYWMAFLPSGKMGIHELPEWPGGYKEGQNHLGTPVSHGCIRLGVGSAEKVYNWADIGTPIAVY